MTPLDNLRRFLADHHRHHDPAACWPYPGGNDNGKGYRILRHREDGRRRTLSAHRVAWADAYGPIPDGAQVDHECHNRDASCPGGITCPHRACVNPAHLAAKTPQANTLEGRTPAAANAAKTQCDSGHPLDGDNLIVYARGARDCRECKRERQRRYDRTRRAANVATYGKTRTPAGKTR